MRSKPTTMASNLSLTWVSSCEDIYQRSQHHNSCNRKVGAEASLLRRSPLRTSLHLYLLRKSGGNCHRRSTVGISRRRISPRTSSETLSMCQSPTIRHNPITSSIRTRRAWKSTTELKIETSPSGNAMYAISPCIYECKTSIINPARMWKLLEYLGPFRYRQPESGLAEYV